MTKFLSSDLWPSLRKAAKSAQNKRIAVAYFTQDHLNLGEGDLLVTNASNSAIASGQTSALVLAKLHRRGVEIYSCEGLHAKVAVLDGMVFVSSANLSASSAAEDGLIEAGLVADSELIRRAALAFIDQLKRKRKTTQVDERFISEINKIEVKRIPRAGVKGANEGIKPLDEKKQKVWMLSTFPIDEPKDPLEKRRIDKGEKVAKKRLKNTRSKLAWVRWPSSSRFAKQSNRYDSLIIIAGQNNRTGHAKVEHHATILHKEIGASGKWTYVYYEPSLHKHKKDLRWTDFRLLAKKAGFSATRRSRTLSTQQAKDLDEEWNSVAKRRN